MPNATATTAAGTGVTAAASAAITATGIAAIRPARGRGGAIVAAVGHRHRNLDGASHAVADGHGNLLGIRLWNLNVDRSGLDLRLQMAGRHGVALLLRLANHDGARNFAGPGFHPLSLDGHGPHFGLPFIGRAWNGAGPRFLTATIDGHHPGLRFLTHSRYGNRGGFRFATHAANRNRAGSGFGSATSDANRTRARLGTAALNGAGPGSRFGPRLADVDHLGLLLRLHHRHRAGVLLRNLAIASDRVRNLFGHDIGYPNSAFADLGNRCTAASAAGGNRATGGAATARRASAAAIAAATSAEQAAATSASTAGIAAITASRAAIPAGSARAAASSGHGFLTRFPMAVVAANRPSQRLGVRFAHHAGRRLLLLNRDHHRTSLSDLFGIRNADGVLLFNIFHIGNVDRIRLFDVFSVGNRNVVGPFHHFGIRHIDRAGPGDVFGIRDADRIVLRDLFLIRHIDRICLRDFGRHRNAGRIRLLDFFSVGDADCVVFGPHLLLRNHDIDRAGFGFGHRNLTIGRIFLGPRFGPIASAVHRSHFGDHLIFVDRLVSILNGRSATTLALSAATMRAPRRAARITAWAGNLAAATWVIGICNAGHRDGAEHRTHLRHSLNHKHVLP